MIYTLKVTRRTNVEGPSQFEAAVAEFPELRGFGWSKPEAKAAVMVLAIARAARERPRSMRHAARDAITPVEKDNPNPTRVVIEPAAPTNGGDMSERNWSGGGWTRGGILRSK